MAASNVLVVLPSRSDSVRRRERFDSTARMRCLGIAGWVIVASMLGRRTVVVWRKACSMSA